MTVRIVGGINAAIRELELETARDVSIVSRRISLQVLDGAILNSPVMDGDFRGAWQFQEGVRDDSLGSADLSGGPTLARGAARIATMKPYTLGIVSNVSDHAEVLDEGLFQPPNPGPSRDKRAGRKGRILVRGGFSTQAPDGILAPVLRDVRTQFGA